MSMIMSMSIRQCECEIERQRGQRVKGSVDCRS